MRFQCTKYEDGYTVQVALVYRGDAETANKFLQVQDEYFANLEAEETEATDIDTETEESTNTNDPVQQANDIINGNADYYDVNEALEEDDHE